MTAVPFEDVERGQRRALRRHRLFATGLLVVMAGVFLAARLVPEPGFWVLLVRAGAEAALVGGLADWFAVTALFRRPLGLPIPHTALVPRNKDRIGDSLAVFVERNFLAPELVVEKLRSIDVAAQLSRWLVRRDSAEAMAARLVAAVPFLIRSTEDEQVRSFVRGALQEQLRAIDLAPLTARLLRALTETGRHQELFDRALAIARRLLIENEGHIYQVVGERSEWWVPKSVDRRVARALISGLMQLLEELAAADHEARRRFDEAVGDFIRRLETSPEARAELAAIKDQVLQNPVVLDSLGSVWDSIRDLVLDDAATPDSKMRRALARAIRSLGKGLNADPAIRARLNRRIEDFVVTTIVPWRVEIGRFIAEVVRGWDARTMTERIELAVGRDLQYVRINGTVVGALVGCALFLLSHYAFA